MLGETFSDSGEELDYDKYLLNQAFGYAQYVEK